ncbi:hypothetical protein LV779_13005 [Streptomyces thinghirensis]|uniref:Uncharacterized protein n=1 Tax=Streptomyces thinghirensis TaxID=551547 RepID=A0ABP9TCB2_9ACTN|nr:hypothetical protein [Streptomyces thinghirensis]
MSTDTETPDIEPGEIQLFVPPDWFDLMADGTDRDATRERCADLVRRTYPDTSAERREEFTDGLLYCYDRYFADGVIMYGVITASLPSTGAQAVWQVYGGVVAVPGRPDELDLGALLSKVFDEQFAGATSYVERFSTDMGLGFGFIAQPPVRPPSDWESESASDVRTGLAGVLSCPSDGGRGLLVIGTCLDPDQVRELAGLVAVIAGHSVFTPSSTE